MATKLARFNLQLKAGADMESYADQWQDYLDWAVIDDLQNNTRYCWHQYSI